MSKMKWVLLDHSRLRNIGGASHGLATRVYGGQGKLWPRLVVQVFLGTEREWGDVRLSLTVSLKEKGGDWWQETNLPTELLGEMPELFREAAETLEKRLEAER